ncbi:hypothetical protein A1353_19635 [Methylomonas methanica]|uniref:Uncharacterized protein n=2 Tax=Methylomonas methanica TaxID=421 RepID=A0A177M461_METMH|nr:hypothetical protein A1353_19635 [Methylomonas methanica]
MVRRFKSVAIEPLWSIAQFDSMATVWPLPAIISPPNDIQNGRSYADQYKLSCQRSFFGRYTETIYFLLELRNEHMNRFLNMKSLTLVLTIISVIIPVWIWRSDLESRSLQLRVASQVNLQPDNVGSISGLQVAVDGVPLKSPYLTVLELSNDGDKPIPSADFEAPLEIRLAEGSVVARAQVTETKPKDIEASLSWETQAIKIKPLLLNPKDIVTVSVLTSGKKPEFGARARIAGISVVPIDENVGYASRSQKAVMLFFAALLLFVASDITNSGVMSSEPIRLRKRAAILVSTTTGLIGAAVFIGFLDTIGVTEMSLVVLAFVGMVFASIVLSVYWNWNSKSIEQK